MISFLKINYQFFALLFIWLVVGVYGGLVIYGVIPLTILLFKRRDFYMELLLGFFFVLIISDLRGPQFAFAGTIKPAYILLLSLFLLFDIKQFQPVNKLYLAFGFFFVQILVLIAFSEILITSLQKTVSYILIYLVVPNYVLRGYRDRGPQFFKDLIYFGAIILGIGLILFVVANDWVVLAGRYKGILGNPNGLGLFCIMYFIMFSVIKHFYKNLFDRTDLIIIYVAVIASVLLCGSRNAMVSILIFLFFERFYKMSPFFSVIILVSAVILNQVITSNMELIVAAFGLEEFLRVDTINDASGRIVAWEFAWLEIQKSLFFGKGMAYDEFLFGVNFQNLSILGHEGGVHSTYFSFMLNAGIFGLLLYFGGFLYTFAKALKKSQIAMAVLLAILFSLSFESWLVASLNPFTIQFLIILTIITSEEIQSKLVEEEPAGQQSLAA